MKPRRKFAKAKPKSAPRTRAEKPDEGTPGDLKAAAMRANSTAATDDAADGDILGGLHNSPSGLNDVANALYSEGGQNNGG